MKSSPRLLTLLCAAAALALPGLRADDPSSPPPPPPSAPDSNAPAPDQQPPPPPRGRHRRGRGPLNLADLTARLGLTADQQKQVGGVIKGFDDQMRSLRRDDSLSDDDRRAKGRALVEATRGQIRALLTADQQKSFDAMPRRGGPPPTPAPTT
ncbi:MAG TPA: hypothetical protein VGG34_14330 [Opitutaceae bacterium]|jgi:hypothetical protein